MNESFCFGVIYLFVTIKLDNMFGIVCIVAGIMLLTTGVINVNSDKTILTSGEVFDPQYVIVVDAGHGEPDGGAVSASGIVEAELNLKVARKLEEKLCSLGYEVVMTRTDEKNIADDNLQNENIRKIKVSDINNRIKIANNSDADMLISIHMNMFSSEKSYGWQTFYKKNSPYSEMLARDVQAGISNNINRDNKRQELSIENVKLIDKAEIPAIIVECGFLSNIEDVRLLQTEEYREQIVKGIVEGVEKFYDADK